MPQLTVAYLGPAGTYSHLVAEKRFGRTARLVPVSTILDVCVFAAAAPRHRGIIPIENSSGGAIHESVDILMAGAPPVVIQEELALNVKLALLGKRGEAITTLYSHFAPLEHAAVWIRHHLPGVRKEVTTSTAVAARQAHQEPHAAALGSRRLARLCALDILAYPVQEDIPNITAFLAIGAPPPANRPSRKTTLAARLPNQPGSLCTFLDTFRAETVNLSRIVSRPIRGSPREYAFLVDLDGAAHHPRVARAITAARRTCVDLRVVGSFPVRRAYTS